MTDVTASLERLNFFWSLLADMVMLKVLRVGHNFKVFYSVVHSVLVFMVDNFTSQKFSPKMLLNNKPVNQELLSVYFLRPISATKDSAFSSFSYLKTNRVPCGYEPAKMFRAIPFGDMFLAAFFNNTHFVINSFCHKKLIAQQNWRLN